MMSSRCIIYHWPTQSSSQAFMRRAPVARFEIRLSLTHDLDLWMNYYFEANSEIIVLSR